MTKVTPPLKNAFLFCLSHVTLFSGGLSLKFLKILFLNQLNKLRSFPTNRFAFNLGCSGTELGATGNNHFIRVHELLHGKRSLVNRNAVFLSDLDDMHAGDTGQDVMIGWM